MIKKYLNGLTPNKEEINKIRSLSKIIELKRIAVDKQLFELAVAFRARERYMETKEFKREIRDLKLERILSDNKIHTGEINSYK